MYYYTIKSDIGLITIFEENSTITRITFGKTNSSAQYFFSPLIKKTALQIEKYLKGKRKTFDIPYKLIGTEFQKKVWSELEKIPYGKTRSYKDIAAAISNPNASRAVGSANNKNPIALIVPCHRVIGINNSLVGYAGGLGIKEYLLNLEQNR